MRIPIAIVMLCLPMAAMGETYVCMSLYQTLNMIPNTRVHKASETSITNYIIDLESGYRSIKSDEYQGECKMDAKQRGVTCINTFEGTGYEGRAFEFGAIDLDSMEFSITLTQWTQGWVDTGTYMGTCTEI